MDCSLSMDQSVPAVSVPSQPPSSSSAPQVMQSTVTATHVLPPAAAGPSTAPVSHAFPSTGGLLPRPVMRLPVRIQKPASHASLTQPVPPPCVTPAVGAIVQERGMPLVDAEQRLGLAEVSVPTSPKGMPLVPDSIPSITPAPTFLDDQQNTSPLDAHHPSPSVSFTGSDYDPSTTPQIDSQAMVPYSLSTAIRGLSRGLKYRRRRMARISEDVEAEFVSNPPTPRWSHSDNYYSDSDVVEHPRPSSAAMVILDLKSSVPALNEAYEAATSKGTIPKTIATRTNEYANSFAPLFSDDD